ncbi:hypothetical protein PN36_17290 [Candidatus Thiomargarita nelsonii]|uniref:Uncharacterized protein n=1 Tax=Candidatus Thiomargarita nelsonii TaxID=1003181 RepID=A0A4E0R1E1_9GAMM|nr:hypothetical protein PN36_17290 [Candidatus Thiomargarita nelsonii]
MQNAALAEQLSFVVTQRGVNEATILAQAISKGIELIYQESVIEAYLLGGISREQALKTLGTATLKEVEYQREALKRDVEWGFTP